MGWLVAKFVSLFNWVANWWLIWEKFSYGLKLDRLGLFWGFGLGSAKRVWLNWNRAPLVRTHPTPSVQHRRFSKLWHRFTFICLVHLMRIIWTTSNYRYLEHIRGFLVFGSPWANQLTKTKLNQPTRGEGGSPQGRRLGNYPPPKTHHPISHTRKQLVNLPNHTQINHTKKIAY